MKKNIQNAIVEMSFIIFLFYSNLLMGEYTRSGANHSKGLLFCFEDTLTATNFLIAVVAAFAGYMVFEFFRRK